MSLNYHELTMNEPRDSPARRKQHLVICTAMGAMFFTSGIQAGLFHSMSIDKGEFPGGEFTHKFLTRDYAASAGILRRIEEDLDIENKDENGWEAPSDSADLMFSVFLDNDGSIPGGKTRFAAGIITDDKEKKRMLLEANAKTEEFNDKADYPKNVKYDVAKLPKVDAAIAMHPTTGGIWTALLQQFKISPALKKYYEKQGESGPFVMVSTCSEKQGMCMYYVPLSKKEAFYLGNELTEEYGAQFMDQSAVEKFFGFSYNNFSFSLPSIGFGGTKFSNVFKGLKKLLGITGKTSGKEEL